MSLESLELEIKSHLANWKEMVSTYQIPSNRKAVLQLITSFLPFLGLWVLMYFSLDWSIWLAIPIGLLNVFFLIRIFIIQHDCGHQSFLRSRRWNNIIGWLCSFFSTIPYKYWAKVHTHHHAHTGQLEERDIGDIDVITVREFKERTKWRRFQYRLFRSPIVLFFVVPLVYFVISNRVPTVNLRYWYQVKRSQVINNVLIILSYIGLGYLLGWQRFLIIHLTVVFGFFCVAFWFFYVQHQHEAGYMRWRKNWDYVLSAIRGSTYYKLPKVFQWLTGNIGLHHIHHLSSLIPNYNLEKCLRENPILTQYANTITFWQSLKATSLKLWDEERKRMISFREFYNLEKLGLA